MVLMMEISLLRDVVIIFGLSIPVIFLFHRIKVPPIVGFIFTGILAGPHGLKIISGVEDVEKLAEIGVILLLFTIGIEMSLKNLFKAKTAVLLGGSLQVGLVIAVTFLITRALGLSDIQALFSGFLVALSSTAIVMKIIQNKGDLGTFHGQTSFALLIFQDIIIVPMILVIPILAGDGGNLGGALLILLVKGAGVLVITYFAARYLVPNLLYQIAKTRSRELFLITIIVIAFAAAWLTSITGLSLALGAFVAGLIISESEYSEQAIGNITPFRDLFTSFFFVSVGMLLNLGFVLSEPLLVILIAVSVLIVKTIVSGFVAFILGYPFRTTVIVGLTLSQIGEFSFVLADIGAGYGLLSPEIFQIFLSSSVITISATPFVINAAPKIADFILSFRLPEKLRFGLKNLSSEVDQDMENHLIIIGFGANGRNVAYAARYAGIPHVIIELNPDTVKQEQHKGELIFYGDASQHHILQHARIDKARILVCTIPGTTETRIITGLARRLNPNLHIIIRTRFINDVETLYQLGASEVIPEEFETSVEIFTRVLFRFGVPHEEIEQLVNQIRSDGYSMFRKFSSEIPVFAGLKLHIPGQETGSESENQKNETRPDDKPDQG